MRITCTGPGLFASSVWFVPILSEEGLPFLLSTARCWMYFLKLLCRLSLPFCQKNRTCLVRHTEYIEHPPFQP